MMNRIFVLLLYITVVLNVYAQEKPKYIIKSYENIVFVRVDTLYESFLKKIKDDNLEARMLDVTPYRSVWYEQILQIWKKHLTLEQLEKAETLRWMFNVTFKLDCKGNVLNFELELEPKLYEMLSTEQLESFFGSCQNMKLPPFFIEKADSEKCYYHLKLPFDKRWLKLIAPIKENESFLKENFRFDNFILIE